MVEQEVADAGSSDVYHRKLMDSGDSPVVRETMTPAARAALKPGDVLGAYQLLLPIGEGGMGRVWVARERQSGPFPRWVAIKTALAEASSNRQFWTVLLDEAHIASRIRHPNVCAIHAVETERSVVYLVMDWSDGGSLREVLDAAKGGKIPMHLATRIVASVCAGLHAAHELEDDDGTPLGVVHRDVSPQNILFSTSGQTKVTDFGVAKARGQLHEPTRTGELKGKLSYMAPEQVMLKDVDRRADVFALGCVLFEATVGKRPFHGNDALATLYSLLEQPLVPPSAIDPNYPPDLEAIVLKSLARDPADRFQTAEEFGYALEAWMTSSRAIVTESQVAALLRETLGDRIKKRTLELQEMVRKVDSGELEAESVSTASGTGTGRTAVEVSTASVVMAAENSSARKRRALLIGVGVALAAAGGLALLLRGQHGSAEVPSAQASTTSTPSASNSVSTLASTGATTAAPEITIAFNSKPDQIALSIDDGPERSTPFVLRVPADHKAHAVRASAHGYRDRQLSVAFDRDQQIAVTLEPASGSARNVRRAAGAPAPPPDQTAAPAPAHHGPGDLPAVVQKPRRALDSDNPFAQ
jgi:serine/threonine-protein kinase